MNEVLSKLQEKYPDLKECMSEIIDAFEILKVSFENKGKLLLCGNGGSSADSDHIVGELMKDFTIKRPVEHSLIQELEKIDGEKGKAIGEQLQAALPAISLTSQTALVSAIANDISQEMVYAQQVCGYGVSGDVLIGLSTSGNSKNVLKALMVAKAQGLKTIGFTGKTGGKMEELCDVTIKVPWVETADIQERHLPIYHSLCILLEKEFFEK